MVRWRQQSQFGKTASVMYCTTRAGNLISLFERECGSETNTPAHTNRFGHTVITASTSPFSEVTLSMRIDHVVP
jgi:hypothetical protein